MAKNVNKEADGGEAPKGKSKMKLLMLLIPVLLVVGGGGAAAAYYFLQPGAAAAEEEAAPAPKPLSYYNLEAPLISNISGSSRLVQVKIALATDSEPTLLDSVKAHETAIRAELLTQLMTADGDALTSRAGKQELQDHMRKAVNAELEKRVGEAGITEVLFTDMVIQ